MGSRPSSPVFLILALALVSLGRAGAGEPRLKLGPAIEEALRNRPELQADARAVAVKEAEIGPAGAWDDPVLGFAAEPAQLWRLRLAYAY